MLECSTTQDPSTSTTPQVPLGIEPPDFEVKFTLKGHLKAISVVKLSPDGKWIASGSSDTTVKLWCVQDGRFEKTFKGHTQGVNDVAWTKDSFYLASCSDDHKICLWSIYAPTLEPLRTLEGHQSYVFCVNFNHQSNVLISGSFDETVRMWDTITGECIKIIPAHADPVSCVQFVMDGSFFASGSYDGLIRLWDTKTGHCLKTLVLNENTSVGGLVFSPNGKYILASTLNNALYLWNIDTGQLERFFRGHTNEQYCLFPCLINDKLKLDASNHSVDQVNKSEMKASDFIVCGSEDGQICFWELQSSYLLAKKTAHSAPVLAVDYCPINSILVTGAIDPDRTLKVWTLKSSAIEKDENPSQSPVKEKDESPTSSSPNLEVETVEMKMEA